jgi:predicted DNA-binding transcriptional regulator AlpA
MMNVEEQPARLEEKIRRMLSIRQVLDVVPVSRTTLFRMERDRKFPPSHEISPKRRAWYEDEVLAWQKALPENDRISRRSRLREPSET